MPATANCHYERFAVKRDYGSTEGVLDPAGITELVVGTGGKSHDNDLQTGSGNGGAGAETESQIVKWDTFGALKLTLHANSADAEFISIDGAFSDKATIPCHNT